MLWGLGVLVLVAVWLGLEARDLVRWQTRMAAVPVEGDPALLPPLVDDALHSWRPMFYVLRNHMIPGALEAQCGMAFHQLGQPERALELATLAMQRAAKAPKTLEAARAVYVMAANGLGRGADAQAMYDQLAAMPSVAPGLLSAGAVVAMCECRFEDAMAIAGRALAEAPLDESAHLLSSAALSAVGRFDEALAALDYTPRPYGHEMAPAELEKLQASPEGREMLAAQGRAEAEVKKPSPSIQAAQIHLERGDVHPAQDALAKASKTLGKHPVMRLHFHAAMARTAAQRGDTISADMHLANCVQALQKLPQHRSAQVELCMAQARALLDMGRAERALEAALRGQSLALHLSEKHQLAFLAAQAEDLAGRRPEALQAYERVVADGVKSWMRERALTRVAALAVAPA